MEKNAKELLADFTKLDQQFKKHLLEKYEISFTDLEIKENFFRELVLYYIDQKDVNRNMHNVALICKHHISIFNDLIKRHKLSKEDMITEFYNVCLNGYYSLSSKEIIMISGFIKKNFNERCIKHKHKDFSKPIINEKPNEMQSKKEAVKPKTLEEILKMDHCILLQNMKILKKLDSEMYNLVVLKHGDSFLENNKIDSSLEKTYLDLISFLNQIFRLPVKNPKLKGLYQYFNDRELSCVKELLPKLEKNSNDVYSALVSKHGVSLQLNEIQKNSNDMKYLYAIYYLKYSVLKDENNLSHALTSSSTSNLSPTKNSNETKSKKSSSSNPEKSFENRVGSENLELANNILEIYQTSSPNYYNIFIKKFGEDFKQCLILNKKERIVLGNAMVRLLDDIKKIKSGKKVLDKETKTIEKSKENIKHYFENRVGTENLELAKEILKKYKTTKVKYYNIIIEKYGEDLTQYNTLITEKCYLLQSAMKCLINDIAKEKKILLSKQILKSPQKRSLMLQKMIARNGKEDAKKLFVENTKKQLKKAKEELGIIKLRRRLSTNEIRNITRLKKEELYRIFLSNLYLFDERYWEIIQEIALHNTELLFTSKDFMYFFEQLDEKNKEILIKTLKKE